MEIEVYWVPVIFILGMCCGISLSTPSDISDSSRAEEDQ